MRVGDCESSEGEGRNSGDTGEHDDVEGVVQERKSCERVEAASAKEATAAGRLGAASGVLICRGHGPCAILHRCSSRHAPLAFRQALDEPKRLEGGARVRQGERSGAHKLTFSLAIV